MVSNLYSGTEGVVRGFVLHSWSKKRQNGEKAGWKRWSIGQNYGITTSWFDLHRRIGEYVNDNTIEHNLVVRWSTEGKTWAH